MCGLCSVFCIPMMMMSLSRIREIEVNLHSKLMTKNDEHNEAFKS